MKKKFDSLRIEGQNLSKSLIQNWPEESWWAEMIREERAVTLTAS